MKKRASKQTKIGILIVLALLAVLSIPLIVVSWPKYQEGCLSLSFDDGYESQYAIAYPLLKEKNFGATFFIIANETSFEGKVLMTQDEIKEIADNNFEIGSHTLTHPHLDQLTSDTDIEKELSESKKMLEEEYKISIEALAFPYWGQNEKVREIAKKYYATVRDVRNKKDTFFLESWGLQKDTNVGEICSYIKLTKAQKLWTILVFHDISDNPRVWDISTENFKKIIDCAKESGIVVDSIDGCKSRQ